MDLLTVIYRPFSLYIRKQNVGMAKEKGEIWNEEGEIGKS